MAVNQSITKKFIPNYKDVNYLSKDFSEFRQSLIEFTKTYYPNTYTDFNEASPGMMFMEMAAYVGDVMSFYIDKQFKENLLAFAQERQNIVAISQALGYKPRLSAPATVEATLYQLVPVIASGEGQYEPDSRYFLRILPGSRFSANTQPSQPFISVELVDFSYDADGKRDIQVFSRNNVTNNPTYFVVSRPIKLIAAQTKTTTYTFGSPQKFSRIEIPDSDIIGIQNVVDSDGNTWSEVDFLGQDLIAEDKDITPRSADGYVSAEGLPLESPPPSKILLFKRKPRRFTTRINTNLRMELWFGSGDGTSEEQIVTLNSTQIGNSKYNQVVNNTSLDPADFLSADTFGTAPANTTLTITYLVGGGIQSNVPSGTIVRVDNILIENSPEQYAADQRALFARTVDSITINNSEPATGGGDLETIEELRQNALAFFNAQNRVVTDKDYIVRTLAMSPKYGSVAKVFVVRDEQINAITNANPTQLTFNTDTNPFNDRVYVNDPVAPNAINLYVLGYNAQKRLTTLNKLVKQNLAKYLEQYRILTDDVNILDAFIVNIGVEFSIVVYRNYNMNDVLAQCIDAIKNFFDVDRWQINQPIILNDLRLTIGSVEGVQTVTNVIITNKYKFKDGRDYQDYRYPIDEAIADDVIYPSLDPCIFEVRYPETDIVGNARQ